LKIGGTLGVWVTGRVLDLTNQDWSVVFLMTAVINVIGAIAFVSLYDSKREFD
jgi:predicted MFS family arabinose efflux permease